MDMKMQLEVEEKWELKKMELLVRKTVVNETVIIESQCSYYRG